MSFYGNLPMRPNQRLNLVPIEKSSDKIVIFNDFEVIWKLWSIQLASHISFEDFLCVSALGAIFSYINTSKYMFPLKG